MPYSSKNRIISNIFRSSSQSAIATFLSSYNIIYNNKISTGKGRGIYSMAGHNNQIIKNHLKDVGGSSVISIWNSHSNTIYLNTIIDNYNSIAIDLTTWLSVDALNGLSYNNKIILNNIENNRRAIWLDFSLFTTIKKNNFINNDFNDEPQVRFQGSYCTRWVRNYWDDWDGVGPYEIEGVILIIFGVKDWYNYDRLPARKPYYIPSSYYQGCGIE
jgi:parallel beta-helix repeat protein